MRNAATSETSFLGLLKDFKTEILVLMKQEIDLAKAEVSEKVSFFGKNAVSLAIGGFVAYAGVIVLFIGLGALIGFALEKAGLSTGLANFLGWTIMGLIVAGVGAAFIMKALKNFKTQSLAPEKTIETLRELKGHDETVHEPAAPHPEPEPKLSSDTIKSNIEVTHSVIEETSEEIARRMSPRYMGRVVKNHVKTHPMQTGLIGAGTTLAGYLWFKRKQNHNHSED